MSLKDRFANHSDTPAEQPQPEEQKSVELYDTAGHARNICFVQAEGSMTFLNYAYLVSGAFMSDQSLINLTFTSHLVEIKGRNLIKLFNGFFDCKIKSISEDNERYKALKNETDIEVSEISISKIKPD